MYIQNIYRPFTSIRFGHFEFGTLVHRSDGRMQRVGLFSMTEDNRRLLSQATRIEGAKIHETDVSNIVRNNITMPVLAVSKGLRRVVTLFSSNIYFGLCDDSDMDMTEIVCAAHELGAYAHEHTAKNSQPLVTEDHIRSQYAKSTRLLLEDAFVNNTAVYVIYNHCLSDFLDEAELEIKEYIARWNRKSLHRTPSLVYRTPILVQ